MAANVDKAIGRLYAGPLDEFVARRNELARSLSKEGDREGAEGVKGLRKPSVAAWAVNQLARQEKMRLRSLFTAGERLRAAHEELLGGGSAEPLERARDDERQALGQLAGAAATILEGAGHPPTEAMLDRVRDTLHAAVVDESVGELVRAGRLEKEERATGFGFATLPAGKPAKRKASTRASDRERRERERKVAREQVLDAEESLREARRRVAEAEKDAKARARELERAERELERRRSSAESAEAELEEARAARDALD
jgi:hypothetical protein